MIHILFSAYIAQRVHKANRHQFLKHLHLVDDMIVYKRGPNTLELSKKLDPVECKNMLDI